METTPQWQAAIRAAQAELETRIAADLARQAADKAAREREYGARLRRVLTEFFAIPDVPELETNEYKIDQYTFSLDWWGVDHNSTDSVFAEWEYKGKQRIGFRLMVERDGLYSEDAQIVIVNRVKDDSNWTSERQQLAYALDELDAAFDTIQSRVANATPPQVVEPPTFAEQIETLIRAIARSEVQRAPEGWF